MAKAPKEPNGKNWKQLRKKTAGETLKNRDVYETQQLERSTIQGKQTMTSRAILAGALGVVTAVTVWSIWSLVDNFRGVLDNKEVKIEEITEPASSVPRNFTELEYANMRLEKTDYYVNLGYDYYDVYTKTFYTEAEYRQWAYVQKQIESGELLFASKYDNNLQRWVYSERDYLAPADPNSVREMSDLEWLNVRMVAAKLYTDIGYHWADLDTRTYYTQAEYEHWLNVTQAAISRYNHGDPQLMTEEAEDAAGDETDETVSEPGLTEEEPEGLEGEGYHFDYDDEIAVSLEGVELPLGLQSTAVTDPAMEGRYVSPTGDIVDIKSSYAVVLSSSGAYAYQHTSFKVTPEQYLNGRWRSNHWLTVTSTSVASDGSTVSTEYLVRISPSGVLTAVAKFDSSGKPVEMNEPTPVTKADTILTLTLHYNFYEWYDTEAIAEKEIITEKASLVAREYDNLTWANMLLMANNTYASLGYNYLDVRTGKYYTSAEYAQWNTVQQRINSGQIKLWREESEIDDGYVYTETPPMAGDVPRTKYENFTDMQWIELNIVEAKAWTDYGWHYADPSTRLYYSDSEYELYKAAWAKVESGEIVISQPPVEKTLGDYMRHFTMGKFFVSMLVGFGIFGILYQVLKRNLDAQNLLNDTSDINQYENDQHIALPEEVQRKFDWFPDVGAHSPVQVSSMISHMMLNNKGLHPVDVAVRADKDILDEDGDVEYYKGEILLDDEGNEKTKRLPLIDMDFGEALFEASGNPKDIRKFYDTTKIPYNPGGKDRTKQGGEYDTVAEMINHEWKFPLYEPQRPAGAYIVDTEPVNTMVLAITRAGKGEFSPVCSETSISYMLIALNSQSSVTETAA